MSKENCHFLDDLLTNKIVLKSWILKVCALSIQISVTYTFRFIYYLLYMQLSVTTLLKSFSVSNLSHPAFSLSRPTWTQIHQCVVWCCPDESDVGSCICPGLPSHSQHGSGH